MKRLCLILSVLFFSLNSKVAAKESPTIDQRRTALYGPIKAYYDEQVKDIDFYVATVQAECSIFPEGSLFPYVLPALAYGNLALKDPVARSESTKAMEILIRPAITAFQKTIGASEAQLTKLKTYQKRATEMGQINLALSLYNHLGGKDPELLRINRHFTKLLYDALKENEGAPIASYPYLTWPFDTPPCIVSLLLHDPENSAYRSIAQKHLDWIAAEGLNEKYNLPYGEAYHKLSRGCDLSLRLPLIRHFAPDIAKSYFESYIQWHWAIMGFREWPEGADRGIDIDSGPIVNDIGLTATGNGVAAVLAFDDTMRAEILLGLLEQRPMWVALFQSNNAVRQRIQREFEDRFVPIDVSYFTGFLYGDAALFYMLTWEDYGLSIDVVE